MLAELKDNSQGYLLLKLAGVILLYVKHLV